MSRIDTMTFASVYPHYINKVERKLRTKEELDEVIRWLTGFSQAEIENHVENETTFKEFFDEATLHPNASLITGTICGVKIQEIEDPLMLRIRYLDKLVDEIAKGRSMEKILR